MILRLCGVLTFLFVSGILTGCVTDGDDSVDDEMLVADDETDDSENSDDETDEELAEDDDDDSDEYGEEEYEEGYGEDYEEVVIDETEQSLEEAVASEEIEDPYNETLEQEVIEEVSIDNSFSGNEIDNYQTSVPPRYSQAEIYLDCQNTGTVAYGWGTPRVKYGCKSYHKSGSYYGIVIGWWSVTTATGLRLPIKDLMFRNDGYDVSFWVEEGVSKSGISVSPM